MKLEVNGVPVIKQIMLKKRVKGIASIPKVLLAIFGKVRGGEIPQGKKFYEVMFLLKFLKTKNLLFLQRAIKLYQCSC